ncbi:MAG: flippase-like domain-containing protein [Acidobacteria bacterium]|uniref:Flippase-like domain-containing protein n=1 Tax=Candidatus Polarisedimenticola svalbardensis TaxID=2886004 RepID=A0A8J6Y4H4_9BACT|nr:flippase-like domain-containing protein [Candidatus Polarisedimenticola svalbardensis]
MWLRVGKIVLIAACVAAVVWLVISLDPRTVFAAARDADAGLLALSLLPLAARFLIWTFKATRVARRYGQVRSRTVLRLILAGAFINLVTPAVKIGGGLYRAAGIRRETGWEFPLAWGWALADQATNILGGLTLFGIAALAAGGPPFLWGGTGALMLVALFFLLRRWAWQLTRGRTRIVLEPVLGPESRNGELAMDIGLAALSWSMLCVACSLVFQALGIGGSFLEMAAVLAVGTTAGVLAGAGGLGVTEFALIGLFTQVGIDPASAAAGTLLHRGILYAVIIIAGGSAILANRRISSC